jgi:hypothetical protein
VTTATRSFMSVDSRAQTPWPASLTVAATSLGGAAQGRGSMVPLRQVSTHTCVSPDGGGRSPSQHLPAVPPLSARRCETARADAPAAVVSTVTLRRFRS